jgi:hypothetical protein
MKKRIAPGFFTIVFGIVLLIGLSQGCAAQNRVADFSGRWTLDKDQTLYLPPSLESYIMSVTQDSHQIIIETDLHSGVKPPRISKASILSGPVPGAGGFFLPREVIVGMALRLKPTKVSYPLDGKPSLIRFKANDDGEHARPGSVANKANWKKDGRALEMQSTRKFKTPEGDLAFTDRDYWEISEDGKRLAVRRIVDMPMGLEEINLIFSRQ